VIVNLGNVSVTTLAVGAGALVVLFAVERFAPRVPGGLVVLVLGIGTSAVLDLSTHGVAIIGDIPSGLPSVAVPQLRLEDMWVLLPSAIGMLLVIYSEALGAASTFADKHGYRLDSNQEMIALGLANIGSAFLGGLAGGGSLSQTAVNDGAGARTQVSTLFAAAVSLVTVLWLTPLFHDLPEAVLAALIIHAVLRLMRVREMLGFYRLIPREFWLGVITIAGVVVLDVLPGLVIGVVLSIVLLIGRASRPRVSVLGALPGAKAEYVDLARHSEARSLDGFLIVRPDATLFYANAQAVCDAILDLVDGDNSPLRAVVLDLDANDDIDITSAEYLVKLRLSLERRDIQLRLSHIHAPTLQMAHDVGLIEHPRSQRTFPDIDAAVREPGAATTDHP
jgi:MFS superfamily sulfate permease-like transporter